MLRSLIKDGRLVIFATIVATCAMVGAAFFSFQGAVSSVDRYPLFASLLLAAASLAALPLLLRRYIRRLLDERTRGIREDNYRLEQQRHAMLRLANSKIIFGDDLERALQELTNITSVTLSVERVSVWLFNSERTSIRCVCQFERSKGAYSSGQEIKETEAPQYFKAIRCNRVLVADDVSANPHTTEFSYLGEAGVASMIDAPIYVEGTLFGVVCHEHVGRKRRWTTDEQNFACSIADMVAMACEVHERRKIEGELNRKSRAIEASLEGIAMIEPDETFSFVNPAFARLFGYASPDDLVGETWRVLYEASQLRKLERHVFVSFMRVGNLQCEAVGLRRDGSTFSQELSLTALGNGTLVCIVRDITQRKDDEQALLESRRFLRSVIDTDPNFIFVKDEHGRFALVNQAVAEAYGTTVEKLIGKTDADFNTATSEVEAFSKDDHYVISKQRELVVQAECITDAQGKTRVLHTVKRPLRVPGKSGVHVLGVSTDITEQRALHEQLIQSQKMEALGQLAGGIAHDFNNLMTGVLGYTTLIKLESGDRSEVYRSADIIEQVANRAAELTQKLLGFARRGKHRNTAVNLHCTVQDTVSIISRTIPPTIQIEVRLVADNPHVLGDPTQLQQILLNLAINARDAMDPDKKGSNGGVLTIETSNEVARAAAESGPSLLRLTVRDTGCGLREEIKERIFEPFFSTKEETQGTGLGLAMVYGIVSNHGGSISVDSEEGKGASFSIVFPTTKVSLEQSVEIVTQAPSLGKGTILVVDDHDIVRSATSDMLQSLGYSVLTARDGVDAVEVFQRHGGEIDLVLLDVVMPRMGAAECLAALMALDPSVRAVVSTGYVRSYSLTKLLDSDGVVGFIPKPFQLSRLSRVVSEALAIARGVRPLISADEGIPPSDVH